MTTTQEKLLQGGFEPETSTSEDLKTFVQSENKHMSRNC